MTPEDLQENTVDTAETMRILGLHAHDLQGVENFGKIKDIVEFFHGATDKSYMIHKITDGKVGPGMSKLHHIWEYVQLRKEYSGIDEMEAKARLEWEGVSKKKEKLLNAIKHFER